MINLFTWNETLSTGFEDVDLQHKKLILIIEEINTTLQSSPEEFTVRMSRVLKKLTDYTLYHFSEEETFMRKYRYPEYEQHKAIHDSFIAQVQSQIKTLPQATTEDGYLFYRFLGNWLITHIAKADQEWASFIKAARLTKK